MGRRLAQKRPAQLLIERLTATRPRSAPPLQLVSCSATVSADVRRQLGVIAGGQGKRAAGAVVTAQPAHPPPASMKGFGVADVRMPSTIRHSAYFGKPAALNQMIKLAFEEIAPAAPLLVLPNGESVQRRVQSLRAIGFSAARALTDALAVPAASQPEPAAGVQDGGSSVRDGDTQQGTMVRQRAALADAFAARAEKKGGVPLLVTTEHSVRGIDLKGIDAVYLVGLPSRVDSYVHVAGRTAREGRKGRAVCLLTSDDDLERLASFGRQLGVRIETIDVGFLTGKA